MYKTAELINQIKEVYGLPSDYAAAKKIGISPQTLSNYVNAKRSFDNKMAVQVAELLNLDPFEIIASMESERAERKEDVELVNFWKDYAH